MARFCCQDTNLQRGDNAVERRHWLRLGVRRLHAGAITPSMVMTGGESCPFRISDQSITSHNNQVRRNVIPYTHSKYQVQRDSQMFAPERTMGGNVFWFIVQLTNDAVRAGERARRPSFRAIQYIFGWPCPTKGRFRRAFRISQRVVVAVTNLTDVRRRKRPTLATGTCWRKPGLAKNHVRIAFAPQRPVGCRAWGLNFLRPQKHRETPPV